MNIISSPIENSSLCLGCFNSAPQSFFILFTAKLGNHICISLTKNLLLLSATEESGGKCFARIAGTRNYLAPIVVFSLFVFRAINDWATSPILCKNEVRIPNPISQDHHLVAKLFSFAMLVVRHTSSISRRNIGEFYYCFPSRPKAY